MPYLKRLTVADVRDLAHLSAQELLRFNQPIPDFESVDLGRLEGCLAQPFATAFGRDAYKGIVGKSSSLFYVLTKGHCFPNGNKRVAIMALFAFLMINDYWMDIQPEDLLDLAEFIAATKPKQQVKAIGAIEKEIKLHLCKLK